MLLFNQNRVRVVFVDIIPWQSITHKTASTIITDLPEIILQHEAFSGNCSHMFMLKPHQRIDRLGNRLTQLPHLVFNPRLYGDKRRRQDYLLQDKTTITDDNTLSENPIFQTWLGMSLMMLPDKGFYQKREKTFHLQALHQHG
jgi:hypothetical protein